MLRVVHDWMEREKEKEEGREREREREREIDVIQIREWEIQDRFMNEYQYLSYMTCGMVYVNEYYNNDNILHVCVCMCVCVCLRVCI